MPFKVLATPLVPVRVTSVTFPAAS
jgi:hypothetical protein